MFSRKSGLVGLRLNLYQPELQARAGSGIQMCQPKYFVNNSRLRTVTALPRLYVHKMHCNDAKTNLLCSDHFDILTSGRADVASAFTPLS